MVHTIRHKLLEPVHPRKALNLKELSIRSLEELVEGLGTIPESYIRKPEIHSWLEDNFQGFFSCKAKAESEPTRAAKRPSKGTQKGS